MFKKILVALAVLAMFSMVLNSVFAWTYPNGSVDSRVEYFGPRADQLLIGLYSSSTSEWETGLEQGQIDVTDWPLDQAHYTKYTANPALAVLGYGAEFGLYLFDMNQNNNTYLCNPPNPAYANPVYPNPMGYSTAESGIVMDGGWPLRAAIIHCVDRDAIVSYIGTATAVPCYCLLPPCYGKYNDPNLNAANQYVDFDPAKASKILNDSGIFPYDAASGWRYWDRNRNGHKDAGEAFSLKLFIRTDDPNRLNAGNLLEAELNLAKPLIRIPHSVTYGDITAARIQVMANKNFHIYTGGWGLGTTPDSIILWNWDFYWHPGRPYNYAGCNKDVFNDASYGVMYANDQSDAVANALIAQDYFAEAAMGAPMYSVSGYKAMSKTDTGTSGNGENWYGVVNWLGYGIDNYWGFLNMHTSCHEYGGIINYGFKTSDIRQMNPIYTEWLWDNTVLGLIGYESLLAMNPYTLGLDPWLTKTYSIGTYTHPVYGTCTKATFTMRDDISWQDGVKISTADVYFTFVEIKQLLAARGLPPPWWYSNVMDILSFSITDPMNFEVLLDVKSIWAIYWIGGNRVMPKHIWYPIVTGAPRPKDGKAWDPTTFAPDPNLIACGPWRLAEYVPFQDILLVANKPGSTVDTGIKTDENANSQPITSPIGFFNYYPKYIDIHADGYKSKFATTTAPITVNFTVTDLNKMQESYNFTYMYPDLTNPVGKFIYFGSCEWQIIDWIDGNLPDYPPDGILDVCDLIQVIGVNPAEPGPIWLHVQAVTPPPPAPGPYMLTVGQVLTTLKTVVIAGQTKVQGVPEFEKPFHPIVETFSVSLGYGEYVATVTKTITTQWLLCKNNALVPCPYYGATITANWPVYVTIKEDIGGGWYDTWHGSNHELAKPDIKVNINDVAVAARAFGTYPGHARWSTIADINHDYKIDIKDVAAIAKKFGWVGAP
jgi:ABC-type transport system substrate-binding protein